MRTIFQETLEDIKEFGMSIEDIVFIGSPASGHSCTWEEYRELTNFPLEEGYELPHDIVILFKDGRWMGRGVSSYDGSSLWELHPPIRVPKKQKKIETLCQVMADDFTIEEIQPIRGNL